jgi:GntR family transcriptional regulator
MIISDWPVSRFSTTVPLYIQIAEGICNRIEAGELLPGERLPSERKLSQMLGVNRMTLRRALEMLESQGLLLRRQGDGTYIAEPKIERQAGRRVPFSQGMRSRGYLPEARVISLEMLPAEAAVAKELGLSVSTPVYCLQRLRLINHEPVMLEALTIPAGRFAGFDSLDLSHRSIYDVFEDEYGIVVVRARQYLEPVVATAYQAELLGVEPGFPMMLEQRLGFDQSGQAVEFGKDLYRGDRFRFVTEIARRVP